MSYVTAPSLKVEVAFSDGPYAAAPTYTDLSSRVRGFNLTRGRRSAGDSISPGHIEVDLDNSDRLLDPNYSSAMNYIAGDKGLPMSPVKVTATYDGTTSDVFYGYLGPECWVDRPAAVGTESVVTMNAFDRAGLYARREMFRPGAWGLICGYLDPEWWVTGDVDFPALSNGNTIPNMVATTDGEGATVGGVVGSDYVYCAPPSGQAPYCDTSSDPTIRTGANCYITAAADDIMAGVDQDDTTDAIFWAGDEQVSDQGIMGAVSPGGSTLRWKVVCNSSGELVLSVYNSGGSLLSSATAPSNPAAGSGGRWDTLQPIHIIVRHEGGTESKLYANGETATTGTAIAEVLESDIVLGAGPDVHYFWHHQHWNRKLSDAEISVPTIYLGTYLGPWRGDTLTQRIGHLYDAFGLTNDATVHIGADDGDYTVGMYEDESAYTSFMGALLNAAYQWGGIAWADKSGGIRIRSITAPDNATHATHYATACANFTDEVSPAGSPTPLRRGPVTFTGYDGDAIVNEFKVQFQFGGESGAFVDPTTVTVARADFDSVAQYGRKTSNITTTVGEWEWAIDMADALVARYATPHRDMEALDLYPWGDDDLTTWILEEAELERAVDVTYTPPSGGSATTVTLSILGIRWKWYDTRWHVSLSLGEL